MILKSGWHCWLDQQSENNTRQTSANTINNQHQGTIIAEKKAAPQKSEKGFEESLWDSATVKPSKHKHPRQKPLKMLEHSILTSTREGDPVLDCFGGSMMLANIYRDLGCRFIVIEIEKHWCQAAVNRLGQKQLF